MRLCTDLGHACVQTFAGTALIPGSSESWELVGMIVFSPGHYRAFVRPLDMTTRPPKRDTDFILANDDKKPELIGPWDKVVTRCRTELLLPTVVLYHRFTPTASSTPVDGAEVCQIPLAFSFVCSHMCNQQRGSILMQYTTLLATSMDRHTVGHVRLHQRDHHSGVAHLSAGCFVMPHAPAVMRSDAAGLQCIARATWHTDMILVCLQAQQGAQQIAEQSSGTNGEMREQESSEEEMVTEGTCVDYQLDQESDKNAEGDDEMSVDGQLDINLASFLAQLHGR